MAVSYMDFTAPDVQYKYDLSNNLLFKKDSRNYIYALGIEQLNTIGNMYQLDIYLSKGNFVEPHWHPNASELTYCITGEAVVSLVNTDTEELINVTIQPGQVVSIPQGWWHYACAAKDDTHILATHDTPMLQTIFGSDVLRLTPPQILSYVYCLDEDELKNALSPLQQTVIIGPPADCEKNDHKHHHHHQRASDAYSPPGPTINPMPPRPSEYIRHNLNQQR